MPPSIAMGMLLGELLSHEAILGLEEVGNLNRYLYLAILVRTANGLACGTSNRVSGSNASLVLIVVSFVLSYSLTGLGLDHREYAETPFDDVSGAYIGSPSHLEL